MKDGAKPCPAAVFGNSIKSILTHFSLILWHSGFSSILTHGAPTKSATVTMNHDTPTMLVAMLSAMQWVWTRSVYNWFISLRVLTFLEGERTIILNWVMRVISLRHVLLLMMISVNSIHLIINWDAFLIIGTIPLHVSLRSVALLLSHLKVARDIAEILDLAEILAPHRASWWFKF